MQFTTKPTLNVGEDTHVIPFHAEIPGMGVLYINPLVIMAKEPVLVDMGPQWIRKDYLNAAFAIVEPKDVRWIFLSHDDRDHSGNLMQVLEMCPQARIITNFVGVGRLAEEWMLPMQRCYFANDGDGVNVGDRTLAFLRPPYFDSPATRGLWDPKSGVYYGVDSFGALLPDWYPSVDEAPAQAYEKGFNFWNRWNHPWHQYVDPSRMNKVIARLRDLQPKTLLSYHAPPAQNRNDQLFKMIADIGTMAPCDEPSQKDLEAMLAAHPG
jgi:flavorubredoxin